MPTIEAETATYLRRLRAQLEDDLTEFALRLIYCQPHKAARRAS